MWCDIGCFEIKVVLCHHVACVLFHRSGCPVENTAVSMLLKIRLMQLLQVLGFHSGINNLHILLLYDITLLGNWLLKFREKVGILFSKGRNNEDDSAL